MATNNYFGFTHNGAQYSALSATAYAAPAQAAYVQQTPTAYMAAPRTAQTYEAYQTSHGAQQFTYGTVGTRTQVVAPVVQAAPGYDATKTYYTPIANVTPGAGAAAATVYTLPTDAAYQTNKYQPIYDSTKKFYPVAPVAAPPAVPTTMYTVTAEPLYQTLTVATSKPVYMQNSYAAQSQGRQITAVKIHTTLPSSISSYTYQPATQVSVVPAVTVTVSTTTHRTPSVSYTGMDGAVYGGATTSQPKYGASASTVSGTNCSNAVTTAYQNKKPYHFQNRPRVAPKTPQLHYCDVCKISCAGPQTYREHLEGQKHKKKEASVKASSASTSSVSCAPRAGLAQLHCKMCDVACTGADTYAAHVRGAKHQKVLKLHASLGKPIPPELANMKKISSDSGAGSKGNMFSAKQDSQGGSFDKFKAGRTEEDISDDLDAILRNEKDIQPVGQEYIDEARNETGTAVSFYCKLCDCKFTDPNAKVMHMKGRRHRLQYKKKVDPSLQVDVKPMYNRRGLQDDLSHRQNSNSFRRRQYEDKMRMEWEQRRYEEEMMEYHRQMNPNLPVFGMKMQGHGRRPDSFNDRHVMAKHTSVYPKEHELEAVQSTVSAVEKALKMVSDHLAKTNNQDAENRTLKGVMRVGPLSKGLLLHGNLDMELVALCAEKPTRSLLETIVDTITKQLQEIAKDEFEVELCVEEAGFVVRRLKEPSTRCIVSLTSPIIREEIMAECAGTDPPDVLDRQKCLDALAALRHAKWFQAKAGRLQSCVIIIRIMRDFCKRIPTWTLLQGWPLELLVEKCISSASAPLSPGDTLRRVFECIASGVILPAGPGLHDPCEKERTDALANIPAQDKEDITASAQQALRMIAFQQIHKVLGMEQLPPLNGSAPTPRKRQRSIGDCSVEVDGKKEKKD